MNVVKNAVLASILFTAQAALGQTNLNFNAIQMSPEGAITLSWNSTINEFYEIDYADSLIDTNTGSITWLPLYTEYPSQGTNTIITDEGNYDLTPEILNPQLSTTRFYRIALSGTNTSPTNPNISIVTPANGDSLSDSIAVQVAASSSEILAETKLYIDGEEQWSSDDGSNFVINTCEWLNGNHLMYATAKSQSGYEGVANGATITYGRSVSPLINVTFNNLISGFNFSQPFFQPALGQTQVVTASFAANVNWALQIQDANSNTVRTATGSGSAMEFDWDGTGNGETNIPDGIYSYVLSVQTSGNSFFALSSGTAATMQTEFEILPPPLPPGLTNSDEPEWITISKPVGLSANTSFANATQYFFQTDGTGSTSQITTGPTRNPKVGNKGLVGSFGILYKTYPNGGFSSPHPRTGWPYPLPTLVAIDGQTATQQTVDQSVYCFKTIADGFAKGMKKAAWSPVFIKADDQWSAVDIQKSSLGGNQIFDTCNFGLLMTHGSYATTAEKDNVKYTYVWLGANNFVRLSDMQFGDSSGSGGLKWMTILACNMLRSQNIASMTSAGKLPIGDNLHMLLGCASYAYAAEDMGKYYAQNLTTEKQTISMAWYGCASRAYRDNPTGITNVVYFSTMGWNNCSNDKLLSNSDPDTSSGITPEIIQVYP